MIGPAPTDPMLGVRPDDAFLSRVRKTIDPRGPSGLMQHHIDAEAFGPAGEHMAHAVSTCVHCGFCLPACPTYRELGEEMDSPRGRIVLMKSALEGQLSLDDVQPHIDRCLAASPAPPVRPASPTAIC